MTVRDHPQVKYEDDRAGTYGNAQVKSRVWKTGAVANNLYIRLMKLFPGMRIDSIQMHVADATVANADVDVGYVNGERDPGDGQAFGADDGDTDYFITGGPIASVGDFTDSRNDTGHRPLEVDEVGYITLKANDAIAAANAGEVVFTISFEYRGNL